jgi:hypothetical protein
LKLEISPAGKTLPGEGVSSLIGLIPDQFFQRIDMTAHPVAKTTYYAHAGYKDSPVFQ